MKTSICPQCGEEFSYYPSNIKLYCSRACFSASRRVWTFCPQCGKEFWYHRSWPRKYCSRACSAAVNAIANLGEHAQGEPPVEVACDYCGKRFEKDYAQYVITKHHFCDQTCFGKWFSQTRTGVPRPEVRGPRPDLRKRVTLTCPQCGQPFETKVSHALRRRFCSKDCLARWQSESGVMSGPNNRNFKGGPEPYYGPNWRSQRRKARERDQHTCQRCGITETELGRALDVHHTIPFRTFGLEHYQDANQLDNLVSLCNVCHLLTEHQTGRST